MKLKILPALSMGVAALLLLSSCSHRNELEVTATAYNSVPSQTSAQPNIGAWGHTLKPGMKVIAVSRDLLDLGLTKETPVKIEGLEGEYLVLDKMNKRWRRKIDIYMGNDIQAAREWGKQTVTIYWN